MRRGADRVPGWLVAVGVVVGAFLVLPALVVIPMSFDGGISFRFPPKQLSLRQYDNFFTNPAWLHALANSFVVGILSALIATVVGTAAAIGLHNLRGRLASFVRSLLMVPIVTPSIVIAVAVYVSFLQWHLVGRMGGFVLAHAAIAVPFVLVSVTTALGGFDARLLRVSASLGASPLSTFRRVTMPLSSRGIVTGAVFAFVTSFDEVVIAVFLHSPQFQTLPVQMYNSVTDEIDPTIAAASSLVLVGATLVVLLPLLIRRKARY